MKSMGKVQKASGVRSLRDTQFRENCALDCGKSSQGRSANGRKKGASSSIVGYSEAKVHMDELSLSGDAIPFLIL